MSLFLWISQCGRGGQARPPAGSRRRLPLPGPPLTPRLPLSISQSARRNPLQCKPLRTLKNLFYFPLPIYFSSLCLLPPPTARRRSDYNGRGGQDETNKANRVPSGPKGGFAGGKRGRDGGGGIEGPERQPAPRRGSRHKGHKGHNGRAGGGRIRGWRRGRRRGSSAEPPAPLPFQTPQREVKLQPPPPGSQRPLDSGARGREGYSWGLEKQSPGLGSSPSSGLYSAFLEHLLRARLCARPRGPTGERLTS